MPTIPGYRVKEVLGLVYATSVRTRGMLGKFLSGIKGMTGGKGEAYLTEIDKARDEVLEEIKRKAQGMHADAILSINLELTEILEGFIVISAYGTAVTVEKEK
jgi:uncharacterized protein YbjQ (UPF0145 family)